MAENKIQENPLPDTLEPVDKPKDVPKPPADKTPVAAPVPVPVVPVSNNRFSIPSLTKTPPNELYRKLLPAVLFLLTFVTVMTMLLIYMDTVALGAQQFRLNMSRDYELARIPQDSPTLVAYVRQLHLAPRAPKGTPPPPSATDRLKVLDSIFGEMRNGTFVEFLAVGARDGTAAFLESARAWRGVVVRAAPRDFLALRGTNSALHACLSPSAHPREVTFQEADGAALFSSRVLCLPLYTVLLAACAPPGPPAPPALPALPALPTLPTAHYALLGGAAVPRALHHVPFARVRLHVIEFRSTDAEALNQTTRFLQTKNYTIAATFDDGIMYKLTEV